MPLFVVIDEQGPAWDPAKPMRQQPGWDEHARFMDALAEARFVVLGGPLQGGPRHRAMLVVSAPTADDARRRLDEDPWIRSGILRIAELDPWELLLGALT